LGLSAAVSGVTYETTAETATPCHLNFVDRKHFLELMQNHCEIGLHTARRLSHDYQAAYRDIHHLVRPDPPPANWHDCCSRKRFEKAKNLRRAASRRR
jgi:CRP-like cAMP-binding protein